MDLMRGSDLRKYTEVLRERGKLVVVVGVGRGGLVVEVGSKGVRDD